MERFTMYQTIIFFMRCHLREVDIFILGDILVCEEAELEDRLSETVDEAKLIRDEGKWVQLFHYPILRWYRKNKGAYHIYGHLHNEQKGKEVAWLREETYALNACVEVNHFEPCTLQELILNNQSFKHEI